MSEKVTLHSRPDLVVQSRYSDEIYAIAAEAKRNPNVYQLAGEALAASLHNYRILGESLPISLIQVQRTLLTAGYAYFPKEYLSSLLEDNPRIHPTSTPQFVLFTEPRSVRQNYEDPHNVIVGADLARTSERDKAVTLLAQAKSLAVVMCSEAISYKKQNIALHPDPLAMKIPTKLG